MSWISFPIIFRNWLNLLEPILKNLLLKKAFEPIKKDGRIKGSKGLNLIGQHNQQKSPEIPRKPPVTAEMKMEEIQHMIDDDEDFDDSILEHDFDDFDDQSHLYHETDSFYFQGEFQVKFH